MQSAPNLKSVPGCLPTVAHRAGGALHRWARYIPALATVTGVLLARPATAAPLSPPGFTVENAIPGTKFTNPTAIAFTPDGRLLIAEKRGIVRVIQNGVLKATPLWDQRTEVLDDGDRGLLGIAVDPQYRLNRRIYLFYTVDPDSDAVDTNTVAFTRLARYETSATDSNVVDPSTRTVLIGASWSDGIPSPTLVHANDCLRFGADGSLLLTHGENAHHDRPDAGGLDPAEWGPGRADPYGDIGSFRAQDPSSMNGKVLRINPENGHGYAGNPFAASSLTAPRAKVWATGFRNPFRFCVRPGTGSADTSAASPGVLCVSDVGQNTWEEIDVVTRGGMNFGWPCREGPDAGWNEPATPAHHGCGSIGTPDNPALPTSATMTWHHSDSTRSIPYGIAGNCASGSLFYTGESYPEYFRSRLFFTDFGAGWMRVATLDTAQQVVALQDFATGLEGPVDCAQDPVSGDIYYVSIYTGEVRRMRYTESDDDLPPVAHASASPIVAVAPAEIRFSSLGSYDPQGEPIHPAWTFGDGSTGTDEAHPSHVYAQAGEYAPILTVSADDGGLARDTVRLVILAQSGYPATAVLDSFNRADGALGAPWVGGLSGLAVNDSALTQSAPTNYPIWNGRVFGGNQEVFCRLDAVTPDAPEHDLLLKVQGTSWTAGCIEIVWNPSNGSMVVNTYTPGIGFVRRGGPWRDVRFVAGDAFGARALSNGIVEVFKNGVVIATTSVAAWPYSRSGGRIGLLLRGGTSTRVDDFGGGDLPIRSNSPPRARLIAPLDGAFFVAQVPVALIGTGDDDEDPPSSLQFHWEVSLRHNNHIHPDILTSDGPTASFVPENHDDGTGVSLIVKLAVADRGGLSGDTTVTLWPEVDLEPSRVTTTPSQPTEVGNIEYRFALRNLGRMLAPISRWMLIADGTVMAQGDTVVQAADSVVVRRTLPSLSAGVHTLRVVADTLGAVRETHEGNNGVTQRWASVGFPSARVLDTFERVDGPIGAPWVGSVSGLRVHGLALEETRSVAYAIWNRDIFGPNQEAFVRFERITDSAPEHDLLLKVQGQSWTAGCVQVLYSAAQQRLVVHTYAPDQGWVRRGGPWKGVRISPGDQFGARAFANGAVIVYRNGVAIASTSVGAWPFAASGGRLGMILNGASASRLIDFGGGDVGAAADTPPTASIVQPEAPVFCAPKVPVALRAAADDPEQAPGTLRYRWTLTVGDTTVVRFGATDSLVVPWSGGPGSRVPLRLMVTDAQGLADTAATMLDPEVNLSPASLVTDPPAALGTGLTRYGFTIRNLGRMPAATSHWALLGNGKLIAEGDTTVSARDSVRIERLAPSLPVGAHLLRVMVDSLDTIHEPDESDNALVTLWSELGFPSTGVLDAFDRPDGPLGAAWGGSTSSFTVRDSALALTANTGYATWVRDTFGPDQEVYLGFDSLTASAPEHDLLLKVQGVSWTGGAIQVVYAATTSVVVVNTYEPASGWVRRGGPWRNVSFGPGDRLGARALSDGRVRVYRNGSLIGECSVAGWSFASSGGRVGILMNGASRTRVKPFAGGNVGDGLPRPSIEPMVAAEKVGPTAATPERLRLSAASANPASGATWFALDLPRAAPVGFSVLDMAGRVIWLSPAQVLPAGRATLSWSGTDLWGRRADVGMYFVRVIVGQEVLTRKVALVR